MKLARLSLLSLLALVSVTAVFAADPPPLKTTTLGRGSTVVLVHGLGGNRTDWLPTTKRLLANHRVVMVDLPGHGDSPTLPDPFSLAAAAAQLDAVLAQQNPESTIVVGHQFGGVVALLEASAHPERMRGLILIDTPVKSPVPIEDQEKRRFVAFMDNNYDAFLGMMFKRLGRDTTQGKQIHAGASTVQPNTIKSYLREMLNMDANKSLKALKVPLALILTERVSPKTETWGTAAKKLGWEDSTRVVPYRVADAGYWIMKDQPDSLAGFIDRFATEKIAKK